MSMRDQNLSHEGENPSKHSLWLHDIVPKILPEQLALNPTIFFKIYSLSPERTSENTLCAVQCDLSKYMQPLYFPIATFIRNCFLSRVIYLCVCERNQEGHKKTGVIG